MVYFRTNFCFKSTYDSTHLHLHVSVTYILSLFVPLTSTDICFKTGRKCFTVLLLSFSLHFSSFHSLHSSPLTGDRKRKRKENDEEKKNTITSPFFFFSYHKCCPLSDSKRKKKKQSR